MGLNVYKASTFLAVLSPQPFQHFLMLRLIFYDKVFLPGKLPLLHLSEVYPLLFICSTELGLRNTELRK